MWPLASSAIISIGVICFKRVCFAIYVVDRVLRLLRNTHWHDCASFDSLLSRAGKGGLFVAPPLDDGLTGLTGSSTLAGTGCTGL